MAIGSNGRHETNKEKKSQGKQQPARLGVESLEGGLNLSSLWGSLGSRPLIGSVSQAEVSAAKKTYISLVKEATRSVTTSGELAGTARDGKALSTSESAPVANSDILFRVRPKRALKTSTTTVPVTVTDPVIPTTTTDSTTTVPHVTPVNTTTTTTITPTTPTAPVVPTTDTSTTTTPTPVPPPPPQTSVPTTSSGVVLVPGTGFTGPTAQPAQIGTGFASSEKAIARWDVVPNQTFEENFNAGVVAFHANGINHVDFSVNGGPWKSVTQMSQNTQVSNTSGVGNPSEGINEYYATLRASDFSDGAVEIRAIVYPNSGVPRVLDPLLLNSNSKKSLPTTVRYVSPTGNDSTGDGSQQNPFASMVQAARSIQDIQGSTDGGVIYLLPGNHFLNSSQWYNESKNSTRWLTISAAPGVGRDEVRITGSAGSGLNTHLVKFENLTISGEIVSSMGDMGWIDSCVLQGKSRETSKVGLASSWAQRFVTNSSMFDVDVALNTQTLIRNVWVERVGNDVFSNSQFVINSSVHDFLQNPGAHADIYQSVSKATNVILYGLTATDRIGEVNSGIVWEQGCLDMAIVDCNINTAGPYILYLGKSLTNLYIANTKLHGNVDVLNDLDAKDVCFESVDFSVALPTISGLTIK